MPTIHHSRILPTILFLAQIPMLASGNTPARTAGEAEAVRDFGAFRMPQAHEPPMTRNEVRAGGPERLVETPPTPPSAGSGRTGDSAGRGLTWTVGPDAACDFGDLQAAIDFAIDGEAIHLMDGGGYTGDTYQVYDKGLLIRGGLPDCDPASEPSGRTVLDADGQGRVFDIWRPGTSGLTMAVSLENLDIRNGSGTSLGGGGVLVEGPFGGLSVELINTVVQNSTTTGNGGGVAVSMNAEEEASGTAMLEIDNDSSITGNIADGHGGGISCDNNGHFNNGVIARIGSIEVGGNTATRGGGIYNNGCRTIFHWAGGPIFLVVPTGAVFNNTATERGGGIYVEGSSRYYFRGLEFSGFGDPDHAAHLISNEAPQGGGAYVGASAWLELNDAVVASNSATAEGGGVYVAAAGELVALRWNDTPCEPAESGGGLLSVPRCTRFRNNSADFGGGMYLEDGAVADVTRTIFHDNSASIWGGAAYVRGDAVFESILAYSNGGSAVFYARDDADMELRWSTLAGNQGQTQLRTFGVTDTTTRLRVYSSVIWSPGDSVYTHSGMGALDSAADCVIGNEDPTDTAFQSDNYYSNIDPELISHADQEYFPGPTSPAIDYCDGFNTPLVNDLRGTERGVAHTGDPVTPPPDGGIGDYDIGAFEADWGNKSVALEFGVEPPDASVGVPFSPVVEVHVIDGSGGIATGDNTTEVELSLSAGDGAATLSGAGPVTVSSGIAVFPDLEVDLAGFDYELTATAVGLDSAASVLFDVLAPELDRRRPLVDFGEIEIGSSSGPEASQVDNFGDGDLVFGQAVVEGADGNDIEVISEACSGEALAPGETCTFWSRFEPTEPGLQEARIRVHTNDPDSPHYIYLRGTNDVPFADGFESYGE